MIAREPIAEVTVVIVSPFVPPLAPVARCWHYLAAVHDVAFVCSSTWLAHGSDLNEIRVVPREYRPFGHLAFI